ELSHLVNTHFRSSARSHKSTHIIAHVVRAGGGPRWPRGSGAEGDESQMEAAGHVFESAPANHHIPDTHRTYEPRAPKVRRLRRYRRGGAGDDCRRSRNLGRGYASE